VDNIVISDRTSNVDDLIATMRRPRGCTEHRLTSAMAAVLAAESNAAAAVAGILLRHASREVRPADLRRIPRGLTVQGETPYTPKGLLRTNLPLSRRADLVFRERGRWALAVEAKLDAPLARKLLDDLLRSDLDELALDPGARLWVLVVSTEALHLGRPRDRHHRWLGTARWGAILPDLLGVTFENGAVGAVVDDGP
jgi:hypothetical protein